MPSTACCLQYAACLLPLTFKVGVFVQESYMQGGRRTFTMPSSACSLQYAAFLLPSTLKFGCFKQDSRAQRPIFAGEYGGDAPVAGKGRTRSWQA